MKAMNIRTLPILLSLFAFFSVSSAQTAPSLDAVDDPEESEVHAELLAGDDSAPAPVPEIYLYKGISLIEEGKHKEGFEELKHAAKGKLPDAYYNLALCYLQGIGRERDERMAAKLFRWAAGKGCAEAQYNLGLCYAKGVGVKQDLEKAVHWWQQAADAGIKDAMLNLAICYRQGLGVPVDEARAQTLEEAGKAE